MLSRSRANSTSKLPQPLLNIAIELQPLGAAQLTLPHEQNQMKPKSDGGVGATLAIAAEGSPTDLRR